MKTKQILWSVIFLILGIFIGGWGIYSYAQDMIMKNLPIGIASLDECFLCVRAEVGTDCI